MAKYSIKIKFPERDNNQYLQLNAALKQTPGRSLKFFIPANSVTRDGEYDVEGNISIADLGNLVSGIAAKINKDYSFTILRNKAAIYN